MEAETVSKPEVVRWRIFGLLVMAAMVLYFQQKSITVASERIMPALTLSQVQIGWLQWAFVAAYGFFQIPGSIWGQRIGARLALSITGWWPFSPARRCRWRHCFLAARRCLW